METISDLTLEIYRAAREMPVDEFQDLALGLVRTLIPFTSSRWMTAESIGKRMAIRSVHLHNEPQDIVLDWETINSQDRFKDMLAGNPGKAFSVHSASFFEGGDVAELRDYTERYRHANTLGIALRSTMPNCVEGFSLYRNDSDHQYSARERHLVEHLMPHLSEALTHNRLLGLREAGLGTNGGAPSAIAIARSDGLIAYANQAFIDGVQRECPGARTAKLPAPLLEAVSKPGSAGFVGTTLSVSVSRLGAMMFLRSHAIDPASQLSPRETAVAELYSRGHSHKEIARRLDIAPATVRNFLQRIYAKLSIRSKIELAQVLAHKAC